MDTRELIKKVRRIEIKTNRLSRHLSPGNTLVPSRGKACLSAKCGLTPMATTYVPSTGMRRPLREPYVKVFEEERELSMMIVADISGSGKFGSQGQMRREVITEIGATLAFSALQNNDKVGLLLFSDRIERYIPPQKGRSQVLRIIREMLECNPQGTGTDIAQGLEYLNAVQRRSGIVFLLSDFLDDDYEQALRITGRKHDLIGIHLLDPLEEELPSMGVLPIRDPETGATQWVDLTRKKTREKFKAWMEGKSAYCRRSLQAARAGRIDIRLGDAYAPALLKFFQKRNKR